MVKISFDGCPLQSDIALMHRKRTYWAKSIFAILTVCLSLPATTFAEILITEIHYNPGSDSQSENPDAPTDQLEFIEFHNPGPGALDLAGYHFTDGIGFSFPDGASISEGEFKVLARVPEIFRLEYGFAPDFGPYTGQLDNGGERLRVEDTFGKEVLELTYKDHGDWPAAADGAGHSMVYEKFSDSYTRGRNWVHSREPGGSPADWDTPRPDGNDGISLIAKGSPLTYFKGTSEPSDGSTRWTNPAFTESQDWTSATGGIGYSSSSSERAYLSTILSDMRDGYVSLYTRFPFNLTASQIDNAGELILTHAYDDGYVIYLNGRRVASANVPGSPPAFDQPATTGSDYQPVIINLTNHLDSLVPGRNILAIQGHNVGIGVSSDFIIAPTLDLKLREQDIQVAPWRRIVINEILAATETQADFIELFNPGEETVDLSGYSLTDNSDEPGRFVIPADTLIEPGGYLFFDATALGFSLSSLGEKILLYRPDRMTVAAGYAWGMQWPETGLSRTPDGSPNWYYTTETTPGQPNTHSRFLPVAINEIMYHHPDGERFEYIELANTSSEFDIDISGWHFSGISFTFPAGSSLMRNQFAIIADDPDSAASLYGINRNSIVGNYGASLRDGGERILLQDQSDIVIDAVEFNDRYPWPVTPDGLGASLERACVDNLPSTADEWNASPIGRPSPGAANRLSGCSPTARPDIRISEVHYSPNVPTGDERLFEFIEIVNTGQTGVDLDGWILAGDVDFAFPDGATLTSGERLVVCHSPETILNEWDVSAGKVMGPYGREIPNGGGTIALVAANGQLVDRIEFDDDFPWPSQADGGGNPATTGASLTRIDFSSEGFSGPDSWTAFAPSPGLANPDLADDLVNPISSLSLTPATISASDEPILEIRFAVTSDVRDVRVEYFADDPEVEIEDILTGEAVQSAADNSVWNYQFGAYPPNSIIRYRIRWSSEDGQESEYISPARGRDQFEWHAWFVDPLEPTTLENQYHLFISSLNWRRLHTYTDPGRVSNNQPNPNWDRQVPATVVVDGVVYDVTVRHQGSRWGRRNGATINFECASHNSNGTAQVRSWRIEFPSYRRHRGIDVLILQKQSGWPQKISFDLFQQAGVPAPETTWAELRINGCDYNSRAFQIERPGRDMVEDWFDEVGDLFKSQGFTGNEGPWSWGDARLIQGALNGFTQNQRYKYTYDRKTWKYKSSLDSILRDMPQDMIEGMHRARDSGPQALRLFLEENFDIDLTLRYICVINYVGTFDDMFQNHYLYRRADNGKWCMFPWDMDNTLGGAFGEVNAHPFRGVDESRYGNVGNRQRWWNRIKDSFFIAFPEEFQQMFFHLNSTALHPDTVEPMVMAAAESFGQPTRAIDTMNHIRARHQYLDTYFRNNLSNAPSDTGLAIMKSDTRIQIQWDGSAVFRQLEQSPLINGPWLPVPDSEDIIFNGSHFLYRTRPDAGNIFFRLD